MSDIRNKANKFLEGNELAHGQISIEIKKLQSLIKKNGDKKEIDKMCFKLESNLMFLADSSKRILEAIAFANFLAIDLKDINWAKEIYQRVENNKYLGFDEMKYLAFFIKELLNDSQWQNNIYDKFENNASNTKDYASMANLVEEELKDTVRAKKLLLKAEKLASSSSDYHMLWVVPFTKFDDKEWGIKLMKAYENKTSCFVCYLTLADEISKYLQDKDWILNIYKKVFKKSEGFLSSLNGSELEDLTEGILKNLGDNALLRKVCAKMEKRPVAHNDPYHFLALADNIMKYINNEDLAKIFYEKAIYSITSAREYKNVEKSIEKYMGHDRQLLKKLYVEERS